MTIARAGIPLVAELFRACGAAEVMERRASPQQRDRGLKAREMAQGFFRCGSPGANVAKTWTGCAVIEPWRD